MKSVEKTVPVEIALRTLDPVGLRQVHAWLKHLENWDSDEHVRKISHPLREFPGVYVLKTSSDIRIFFRIDGDTISVLDIAKTPAIIASGAAAGVR